MGRPWEWRRRLAAFPVGRVACKTRAPARIEQSATVQAQPHDVYCLVADPTKRVRWLPELDATSAPARPLVRGDRFDGVSSIWGHRFLGTSDVVDADADTRLEERVVLGAALRTTWTFKDNGHGGTVVTNVFEVDFPDGPLGRAARLLLRRRLAHMQRAALGRLGQMVAAPLE